MRHGVRATYVRGCRCPECTRAARHYNTRQRMGVTGHWVPDAPVREHVMALRAQGMGKRVIANQAGVGYATVDRLSRSAPDRKMHSATAARILAVTFHVAPGRVVSGHGTQLRLRALVAIGWTQTELARRIGWTCTNLNDIVVNDVGVQEQTRAKVAALYRELCMTPGPSNRARNHARRRGWAPPLALDDDRLDEPNYAPDPQWIRGNDDKRRIHIEDVQHLRAMGESWAQIAARYGVTTQYLTELLRKRTG